MAAVQLGLWRLIEKYGLPLLNTGVAAIMTALGVPEDVAKDIMANKLLIAFEEVGIFAATLKTRLPIRVAEYLGFTSKGYILRTLGLTAETKIGTTVISATSKVATTLGEVTEIAKVVSQTRSLSTSLVSTLLNHIWKFVGLSTAFFFMTAQYIDFANWQGPYQKVFQGLLAKFGLNPDTPLPKANTISPDNWKRLYSVIEELKPLGIAFPFSDKDRPYSRQALSDLVDELASNMTLQGTNPTYKNLIATLLPLIQLENRTRTNAEIDTILAKVSTTTVVQKTVSTSVPSVKVFTGIVSQGVVGAGLVFTARPDDLIESVDELTTAAVNNLAPYLSTLLRKIVYEVKVVSSVVSADGFRQTGQTQRIQTGTWKDGTPKYKTVTNKFATLIIYAVTDKGSRAKLSTIVLGPVDSAKLIVRGNELQELQNKLPALTTTTDIKEIETLVTKQTVNVQTPAQTGTTTPQPVVSTAQPVVSPYQPVVSEIQPVVSTAQPVQTTTTAIVTVAPSAVTKPGANATTLYEWYTANGQALPPVSVRASAYQALGLGQATYYIGTAEQNTNLLNALKK
ncbi:MAG: hypothetical protein AAB706_00660 [Patescibacteria group bacterium]